MRGLHDRHLIQRRRAAALTLQKVERGHLQRSKKVDIAESELQAIRQSASKPAKAVRVVVCGCDWSGRVTQAHKLAARLLAPCVQLIGDAGADTATALSDAVRARLEKSESWVIEGGPTSAAQTIALLSLPRPPTHWILCTIDDAEAEARGLAALASTSRPRASWTSRPRGAAADDSDTHLTASSCGIELVGHLQIGSATSAHGASPETRDLSTAIGAGFQRNPSGAATRSVMIVH